MSYREFQEWLVFYAAEPFGDFRADIQAGTVASVIANTTRDPKKRPRPYSPTDFIPDYTGERERRRILAEEAQLRAFFEHKRAQQQAKLNG